LVDQLNRGVEAIRPFSASGVIGHEQLMVGVR
jgi:hypothetical protein